MARATDAHRTTHHDTIREWVETRGGLPSVVRDTWNGTSGMLRIDFGEQDDTLEEISWGDFFRIFDENELALLYQDKLPDGRRSRFCKFVERTPAEEGIQHHTRSLMERHEGEEK